MNLPAAPWLGVMIAGRGHARGGPGLAGTTLGIALSLVPVIVVLVVADGMIEGITGRFLEVDTYHARIVPPAGGDAERLPAAVRAVPGVMLAEVEVRSAGLLFSAEGLRTDVLVRFVSPDLLQRDAGLRRYLSVEGSFDLQPRNQAVIGRELAETLGVTTGDQVGLWVQGAPRLAVVRIAGVYRSGYQHLDGTFAFMGAAAASDLGATGFRFLGVKVRDPFGELDTVIEELGRMLPPEARLIGWFDLQRSAYRSFRATKVWLTLIMAVIALVATVNVASALRMLLIERSAEMAYVRAMGGSGDQVGMAFLTVGLVSGAAGGVAGVALGLAAAVNVNELLAAIEWGVNAAALLLAGADGPARLIDRSFYLERIPVRPDPGQLLAAVAAVTVAAAIAAVRPALHAARLRPVESLRQR